jgi:hypothetical protein
LKPGVGTTATTSALAAAATVSSRSDSLSADDDDERHFPDVSSSLHAESEFRESDEDNDEFGDDEAASDDGRFRTREERNQVNIA